MTDRELLEFAAKAARMRWSYDLNLRTWNPLADDGDAFRLALLLGILVWRDDDLLRVNDRSVSFTDVNSAARLAIVEAAAKIGSHL